MASLRVPEPGEGDSWLVSIPEYVWLGQGWEAGVDVIV